MDDAWRADCRATARKLASREARRRINQRLRAQASQARAEAAASGLPPPVGLRRSIRGGEELSILDSVAVRAGRLFPPEAVVEKAFRVADSFEVPGAVKMVRGRLTMGGEEDIPRFGELRRRSLAGGEHSSSPFFPPLVRCPCTSSRPAASCGH